MARRTTGPATAGGGQGLEAQYLANTSLSGTPVLTRVDPTVNFTWTGVSPGTGVPNTNFSVVWTGWVQARYTETYTFYTSTDDGARLDVNGTQLVDHFVVWTRQCHRWRDCLRPR